jgi:hypothetical protein
MKVQSKAIVTTATYEERKLILAKPQTYMNLSGQSAQGLLNFYKLPMENMLVAHDDLDIPLAQFAFAPGVLWTGGEPTTNSSARRTFQACALALVVRPAGWILLHTCFRISCARK